MTHKPFPKLASTQTALQSSILHHFRYSLGREWQSRDPRDRCLAVSLAVRDRLVNLLLETEKRYQDADAKRDDTFPRREPGLFRWLFDKLIHHGDEYFHLADFHSYAQAHEKATQEYSDPSVWARKAILNVARIGKFSSDRNIMQYAEEIWDLKRIP